MYEGPMDMDNRMGMDCGSGGWGWAEEGKGGKMGTAVIEKQ